MWFNSFFDIPAPQPDDPQDAVVARQYVDDISLFKQTARMWTNHFAMKNVTMSPELEAFNRKIRDVSEVLEVDRETALVSLSQHNWNFEDATNGLL